MHNFGIAIQIGLFKTAEFSYLGHKDWRERIPVDPLKCVPETVQSSIGQWRYFGVDACPRAVSRLAQDFYTIPNAALIHACVKGTPNRLTKIGLFREAPHFVKSFSITLDMLVDALEIDRLDVLAIDIEGNEYEVLQGYSFRLRPRFLTVESHEPQFHWENRLAHYIKSLGYKLINEQMTNHGNTIEYQFLDSHL